MEMNKIINTSIATFLICFGAHADEVSCNQRMRDQLVQLANGVPESGKPIRIHATPRVLIQPSSPMNVGGASFVSAKYNETSEIKEMAFLELVDANCTTLDVSGSNPAPQSAIVFAEECTRKLYSRALKMADKHSAFVSRTENVVNTKRNVRFVSFPLNQVSRSDVKEALGIVFNIGNSNKEYLSLVFGNSACNVLNVTATELQTLN